MTALARLEEEFASGRLVRPFSRGYNLVHLSRALALSCGIEDFRDDESAREIQKLIGEPDHLVFVLIDGLGMNMLKHLPRDGFLINHLRRTLESVFPTSTAPALTTIATGQPPAIHSLAGWVLFIPTLGKRIRPLPYVELETGKSLSEIGSPQPTVVKLPSLLNRYRRDCASYHPDGIANTAYSRYFCGEMPDYSFDDVADGFDQIVRRIQTAKSQTFSYLYYHELDTLSHSSGVDDASVRNCLEFLDREIEVFHDQLRGQNVRFLLTADHGQVTIEEENHLLIQPEDPILKLLKFPPTGEKRTPFFHVKDGQHDAFRQEIEKRWGDRLILLTPDEAQSAGLFGPTKLTAECRARLGDFLGIGLKETTFQYSHIPLVRKKGRTGNHGGLTSAEMQVPLFVG